MNWTKEEIKNSREIAKYFRKEITYGDWYWDIDDGSLINHDKLDSRSYSPPSSFPLWTLTDCLEWLEKKIPNIRDIKFKKWNDKKIWRLYLHDDWHYMFGNTLLIASTPTASAQLAVLEILKGEKDE